MKNLFVSILFVCVAFIGCDQPQFENVPSVKTEYAHINIPLSHQQTSRSVSIDDAIELTHEDMFGASDYFGVFFRRHTGEKYSADANLSDEYIEMQIPIGTYDIVLMAGIKAYDIYGTLYASGYLENKILRQVQI